MIRLILTIALTALLSACNGRVTIDPSEPQDAAMPALTATATPSAATSQQPIVTIEGDEPDPGVPCEGDAMCWPLGYCAAGYCAPQSSSACMVGGKLIGCDGGICCDLGNDEHECMAAGDCEPEGKPL